MTIEKKTVELALSKGYKVKATNVDNLQLAQTLQSFGVKFITTNELHPFYIKNEYREPIFLKCTQFDFLADCQLGREVELKDNEIYSIYYSTNIYKIYEDIQDNSIGEFKYLDTIKLDDRYYEVITFNFEKGYIILNTSLEVE